MNRKLITYNGSSVNVEVTNPEDHIQKFWMRGDFYETKRNGLLPYLYEKYKGKKNFNVIDCGAHMGNHTLFFTKVMKANCLAIEALPKHFAQIHINFSLNKHLPGGQLEVRQCALGYSYGLVSFKLDDENNTGGAYIDESVAGNIEMRPLDDFINVFKDEVAFIKVDIEGGNIGFLEGAKATLAKFKPDIYIECATKQDFEDTRLKLDDMFYKPTGKVFNATPTYEFVYNG